jgi:hypothetical protein
VHLPLLPTCMLSCVSSGDPFVIESMPPERAFLIIGAMFPFTVHTATKVQTRESIHSGGYQSGLHVQIALAATTVGMVIVPRMGTRAPRTVWSTYKAHASQVAPMPASLTEGGSGVGFFFFLIQQFIYRCTSAVRSLPKYMLLRSQS